MRSGMDDDRDVRPAGPELPCRWLLMLALVRSCARADPGHTRPAGPSGAVRPRAGRERPGPRA
jgi:hypothetical protein